MTERHDDSNPGRTLRCDEAAVLLMGFIDEELSDADRRRTEDHLAVCVACRREEQAYRQLGQVTASALGADRHDSDTDAGIAWMRIYERLETGLGYVLVWIGITLLAGFGLWQLAASFLTDGDVPLAARAGVASLTAGSLILLVSFVRDRLRHSRSERYREVQR